MVSLIWIVSQMMPLGSVPWVVDHILYCWVANSLFRQQQGRSGLGGELEVETLVAMEWWKYPELAS